MTSWHLADLESSLVPTCTNILYTGCWGPHQMPILTATASVSAGRGNASRLRRRAGTAWACTQTALPGLIPSPRLTDASPRSLRTYADLYRRVLTLSLLHVPGNVSGVSILALATRVDIASQLWHSSPALGIASPSPLPASNTAQQILALLSLYLCAANIILAPTKSGCSFTNCLVTSR